MTDYQNWIGKTEQKQDLLRPEQAQMMAVTLGQQRSLAAGDALPPLWHWLYFLEAKPPQELGRDGHPKRGGFLPPVALPRRMWAGGRFEFHARLILGERVNKHSEIVKVASKTGRSGDLCFVTVRHRLSQAGVLCVVEDHDIVYREDPSPDQPKVPPELAPDHAEFSEEISADPVLLFRYSALTFNGHRIHYDIDYARSVEGYDGLVFHGPLTATLLVDLACRQKGRVPRQFSFRGLAPIAGQQVFSIEGKAEENRLRLWAKRGDGALAMRAEALF